MYNLHMHEYMSNIQGVFLSDIFETLITPSILKIIDFCKKVMTNQTGQFDNCIYRFLYVNYQESCDNLFTDARFDESDYNWISVPLGQNRVI